jgi:hypothetical protein
LHTKVNKCAGNEAETIEIGMKKSKYRRSGPTMGCRPLGQGSKRECSNEVLDFLLKWWL